VETGPREKQALGSGPAWVAVVLPVALVSLLLLAASPSVDAPRGSDSVYDVNPWIDGPVLVGTAASWPVLATAASSWIEPHCPCPTSEVPGIDRVALGKHSPAADQASTVTLVLALAAPVVVDLLDVGFSAPLAEDMTVYAEVLTISGTATELAKHVVQRPRPYVYGSTSASVLESKGSYTSFFSGHVSATVGALTALAMTQTFRHGSRAWWSWLVTALVGTSVAIERVAAGQHFPTDVLTAGLVGGATGLLLPWLHARRGPVAPALTLTPVPGGALLVLHGEW
jgi:membrane-associated phospholipid phosphatase